MAEYNLIENFYDMQRYVKTCADRANLEIVWGKPDDTPATDGKRVLIPRPDDTWTADKYERLKYAIAHEVAHVLYTDFGYPHDPEKDVDMNTKFGMVWNVIEDHRIDYLNSMVYAGDYGLCKTSYATCYDNLVLKNIDDDEFAGAILGNMMLLRSWQPDMIAIADKHYSTASDTVRANADRFVDVCSELIKDACDTETLRGTQYTYEATCAYMSDESREEAEQKAKDKRENAEGDGGSAEGKKADKEDKAEKDALKNMAKAMVSEPDMSDDKEEIKADKEYKDRYDEDYIPDVLSDILIEDFVNNKYALMGSTSPDRDVVNFVNRNANSSAGMANKLRTKLQILSRSRIKYGTKSGKLHANALHRLCIPDGGEYSTKIFKRKEDALSLDVSVTVLVDMSGSMNSCGKYEHAALATTLLNEALGTVLRVPLEILGFTESIHDGRARTHMAVLKNFNAAMPKQRIVNSFGVCKEWLYENTDGEAILFAHDRLLRQRTKRKILFVLSDGDPAGGYSKGNIRTFTKKVINHIQTRSPVEIYGIGFMNKAVERFYKERAVIDDVSDIENSLVQVITKKVFGV